MKKVFVVVLLLVLSIGFTSCEPESVADTDDIYASDKDEEPDRKDRDS